MVTPSSIIFLALSHAPPAFDWNSAINTPADVTPARRPPSISGPPMKPNRTGTITARRPGTTISRMDACVEIATHFSYSAFPSAASKVFLSSSDQSFNLLPSFLFIAASALDNSGISLNCRRTSSIILIAARPTAFIESAENKNGSIAPTNNEAITKGLVILIAIVTPGFTVS